MTLRTAGLAVLAAMVLLAPLVLCKLEDRSIGTARGRQCSPKDCVIAATTCANTLPHGYINGVPVSDAGCTTANQACTHCADASRHRNCVVTPTATGSCYTQPITCAGYAGTCVGYYVWTQPPNPPPQYQVYVLYCDANPGAPQLPYAVCGTRNQCWET